MSDDEAVPCRGCGGPLREARISGHFSWICPRCGGALVEVADLIPVLTVAAREVASEISFDHPIEPVERTEAPPCPDCDGPMQSFGYMGTNLVYPARCNACALVWMGPGVMDAMTLLFARTNLRNDAHIAELQTEAEARDRRMTSVVMNRVRESWMIGAG